MRAKVSNIVLDSYGDYLSMTKGCFHVKHRNGKTESYPEFQKLEGMRAKMRDLRNTRRGTVNETCTSEDFKGVEDN